MNAERLLPLLLTQPTATNEAAAAAVGVSAVTIDNWLRALEAAGKITRQRAGRGRVVTVHE